jgi:hypothetical protein
MKIAARLTTASINHQLRVNAKLQGAFIITAVLAFTVVTMRYSHIKLVVKVKTTAPY